MPAGPCGCLTAGPPTGRATAGAAVGAALGLTLVTIFPGFALLVGGPLIGALNATVAGTIGGIVNDPRLGARHAFSKKLHDERITADRHV